MIKHKEFYEKWFEDGKKWRDNMNELKKIMPYHFDDKKQKIRTIILKQEDGDVISELPVYRVILDSRNMDDLLVMLYEEMERAIMFSDILLENELSSNPKYRYGHDEVSVDYIVENLPQFVQDAIYEEKIDLHWGAKDGVDVNRYYADVEYNYGIDYYYNNVKQEDDENLKVIKDMIERNAKIRVEFI